MAYSHSNSGGPWTRSSTPAPMTVDLARVRSRAPKVGPKEERSPARAKETGSKIVTLGLLGMIVPMIAVMALLARPKSEARDLSPDRSLGRDARAAAVTAGSAVTAAAGHVSGLVLDATGNRAARATIRVVDGNGSTERLSQTTENGAFSFEGIAARKIRFVAEDEVNGFATSEELEAADAQGIVLVLQSVPDVSGTIQDERGAAVARATVKVWGKGLPVQRLVTTDDDGRYLVRRVPSGADRVSVWAHGYRPISQPLTGAARQDARLFPAPSIRGVVVTPEGRPVWGAEIAACEGDEAEAAISDVAGEFSLPATTVGCSVTAHHIRWAMARPVVIENDRRVSLQMGAGGAIEGMVVDANGRPVNSFTVSIDGYWPADGESNSSGRVTERTAHLRGKFRLEGLAPGEYVISSTIADGDATGTSEQIKVGRGKVVRGVRVVLAAPATDETPPEPEPEPEPEPDTSNSEEPASAPGDDTAQPVAEAAESPPTEEPAE